MKEEIKTYNSKVDSKNRITLRNNKYEYYSVKIFKNGNILLEPRILVAPFEISKNALDMMDKSMTNFKKSKVSKSLNNK